MSANELLGVLIQLLFVLLGFVTTVDFVRYKGKVRRDIALMFNSLGIPYIVPVVTRTLGIESGLISFFVGAAVLTQPFLLLRIVQDFRPVSRCWMWAAGIGMVFSWIAVAATPLLSTPLRVVELVVIIGYFFFIDGYAMFAFVRGALTTSGVVRQRLRFAAAGSGLLAFTLVAGGFSALIPPLSQFFIVVTLLSAIFAAFAYYVGFAPPRWLRRAWQFAEFRNFLLLSDRKSSGDSLSVSEYLEELCQGAVRAVGGLTASVALRDEAENRWGLRHVSDYLDLVDEDQQNSKSIVARVWHERKSLYIRHSDALSTGDRHLLQTAGADSLLVAPIAAGERTWGLLLVFLKRSPLFIEDDLDLVTLLAQQSATFLENRALVEELRDYSSQLEGRVTERTKELEESREEYRRIVETAHEGIWVLDSDNNTTFLNARMAEMLGYTTEELCSLAPLTVVDEDDQAMILEYRERRRQGIKEQFELRLRRKDGCVVYTLSAMSPLMNESGQYIGVLAMFADISERKEAELKILNMNMELERRVNERTAQLSAVNHELEAFSYSVSHDLRAPLRAMDGFSLALMEDYDHCLDGEGQSYLQRIRTNSQRMGQLIDALLQLSGISRTAIKFEQVNLSELARNIAADLADQNPGRSVEIVVKDSLMVNGDERMLRVVLTNLFNNAWKFTRQQAAPRVELGIDEEHQPPTFYIRDNGVGFDNEHTGKLFRAFQRLHGMTEFEGTGIGLATVARIINLHGGQIWADGIVDKGATFYFKLHSLA